MVSEMHKTRPSCHPLHPSAEPPEAQSAGRIFMMLLRSHFKHEATELRGIQKITLNAYV